MNPQQLSLGVGLADDATFENFFAPSMASNAHIVAALKQQIELANEPFIYLWGASGCGITHLLQAACHLAQTRGKTFQYFPLCELASFDPEDLFADLGDLDFVCIDGLDVVAAKPHWEHALFSLYNQLRDNHKLLLVASNKTARELPMTLEDLRSRLQWGASFQVKNLDDNEKQQALQFRARARGLELSDDVATYIIQRLPRDMNALFLQLNRLDQASLAEQRKLTIPFIKKVLGV
jgi:DnaA-homolog protein